MTTPRSSDDRTSGRVRGVEFIEASAGVEDVVLSFNFVAARSQDVDGGIKVAVGKPKQVLADAQVGL